MILDCFDVKNKFKKIYYFNVFLNKKIYYFNVFLNKKIF
jgi:hypothetical protein